MPAALYKKWKCYQAAHIVGIGATAFITHIVRQLNYINILSILWRRLIRLKFYYPIQQMESYRSNWILGYYYLNNNKCRVVHLVWTLPNSRLSEPKLPNLLYRVIHHHLIKYMNWATLICHFCCHDIIMLINVDTITAIILP